MEGIFYFVVMAIATMVIKNACESYEQSASYLGRNMGAGARGALLDAIGSSLPELFVTFMFVLSRRPEVLMGGIAVTAGSAIFNAVVIPAFSIFFAKDKAGNPVNSFQLDKNVILRDGAFLIAAEGMLIQMLGEKQFSATMCAMLVGLYGLYAAKVMYDSNKAGEKAEEYEFEKLGSKSKLDAFLKLDANYLIFGDKELTTSRSWINLSVAVTLIGIACHYLAVGIEGSATVLGVDVYVTAVLLGAAATSVPDTILSIKSAQRGDYEDAVGNAIGSNIFDVTISLGIPLFAYICLFGEAVPIVQSADLTGLRIFVLGTSAGVVGLLYAFADNINRKVAFALFGMYAAFIAYIAYGVMY